MQKRWINKNRKTIKMFLYIKEKDVPKNEILSKTQEYNKSDGRISYKPCGAKCVMQAEHTHELNMYDTLSCYPKSHVKILP